MSILNFFRRRKAPPAPKEERGMFSTHPLGPKVSEDVWIDFPQPDRSPSVTSDSLVTGTGFSKGMHGMVNSAQLGFYAAAAYPIGYQASAMLATNWLIDKACAIPARDAVRQGWAGIPEELRRNDGHDGYQVAAHLRELIHFGRIYGGRLLMFVVDSENPEEWYKNPLNLDGIQPGAYKGMSQIDPNWVSPVLTDANLDDPAGQNFYNPTYWRIKDRVVHRSHLYVFTPYPVPDFLKPAYNYLGVSVPQRIMERVYAAERSANEGPQLLMSKRVIVAKMADRAFSNPGKLRENLEQFSAWMNSFGIWAIGKEEAVELNDTSLADVDTTIMTQYQLVSSAANVPATKLFNVQPKGFNSTGEYEEASYREELESIQTNDLSPVLEMHYKMVARSLGVEFTGKVIWEALDSPTRKEFAEIEKLEAERDTLLFNTGAIDGEDVRNRIRKDREGSYHGIEEGSYENPIGQTGQVGGATPGGTVPGAPASTSTRSGLQVPRAAEPPD